MKIYELTDEQEKKLEKWKKKVYKTHEDKVNPGLITVMFTQTGVGMNVVARHNNSNMEIDLTEYDKW